MRHVSAGLGERFAKAGFALHHDPLPFNQIVERSRILVSHGGHGFVCSALLAGLPQLICHYDIEKRLHANAVAAMQLGGHVPLNRIQPDTFATFLSRLYEDEDLADRARAAGVDFRSRVNSADGGFVIDRIDSLLRN